MALKVLIVDDSVVFRSQIKSVFEGVEGIQVVGVASNGKIALDKLNQFPVDLMTLDLEMPEMNGLQTLAELKRLGSKVKVIVFSSRTQRGADAALEALTNGAADVVAKPGGESKSLEDALAQVRAELLPKVLQFVGSPAVQPSAIPKAAPVVPLSTKTSYGKVNTEILKPKIIVIGSSTGGPDALEKVFRDLPCPIHVPILITQHMPPIFTASLAKRLAKITGTEAAEGKQWEEVKPNRIYVAPGDYHMSLSNNEGVLRIKLDQGPKRQQVRPAVDPLFETAAEIFGKACMGFVLTGMGEDGLQGAHAIKKAGGAIMIQDAGSCVVFGMPGAIHKAGIYDAMGDLAEVRRILERMATGMVPFKKAV